MVKPITASLQILSTESEPVTWNCNKDLMFKILAAYTQLKYCPIIQVTQPLLYQKQHWEKFLP